MRADSSNNARLKASLVCASTVGKASTSNCISTPLPRWKRLPSNVSSPTTGYAIELKRNSLSCAAQISVVRGERGAAHHHAALYTPNSTCARGRERQLSALEPICFRCAGARALKEAGVSIPPAGAALTCRQPAGRTPSPARVIRLTPDPFGKCNLHELR